MNTVEIVTRTPTCLRVHCEPGSCIQAVCADACVLAARHHVDVVVDFNGIELTATPSTDSEQLVAYYTAESDRKASAWRESLEGQQHAREQHVHLIELQSTVDSMIADLDAAVTDQDRLVAWIGEFATINDHIGLVVDRAKLASTLIAAGYEDSAEVGASSEAIRADKSRMARYIVGQAIDHLRSGMPVHPVCAHFAATYAAACS